MPLDNRRLPVPETSQTPYAFNKTEQCVMPLMVKDKRTDGRSADQTRPVFIKAGVVSQAKGSAYIELNDTKVICAVYGPREVVRREDFSMKGQLLCEFKYATFSCRYRRHHQQDSQERDYSVILREALEPAVRLEKFPKARMDVFVTVLQDGGSALAACISCASVALADAGVEMYDLVVGCSLRQSGDLSLIDPDANEEYKSMEELSRTNDGGLTVGFMPSLHQVSALEQKGQMDLKVLTMGLRRCVDMCHKLYPVLQQCLVRATKARLDSAPT